MTVLVPRFVIGVVAFISLLFWVNILMVGHPMGEPLTGVRKKILAWTYKLHVYTQSVFALFTSIRYREISLEQVNHYQEYLGTKEYQA